MKRSSFRCIALAAVLSLVLVSAASATIGYFSHGYGTTSKGLAGAGVAMPQDALAAASNPAGMAFLGKRRDVGLAFFNPNRSYTVEGTPSGFPGTFGLRPGKVDSGSEFFAIPNFGLNWDVGSGRTFGVSVYGNGGMNSDYPTNTFFGTSPTGVDLSQLFIAPTYAFTFGGGDHAIGISAIIAFQRFEAQGLQAFGGFSANPASLTNNGHDQSFGFGARVGYLGRLTPRFSIGFSYQSEIEAGEFDDYAGLFAEQGGFNIPGTWTAGIAVKLGSTLMLAIDIQEIFYSDVPAIANPLIPNIAISRLGNNDGAGFGWEDMTILKLGLQWGGGPFTWRVGFATGDQPIPDSEVLFNILAPGVVEDHFTVGFTRRLASGRAFSLALMHAPKVTVRGPNPLEVPGLQTIALEMDQWDLEIGYSW